MSHDAEVRLRATTDAQVWASEFMAVVATGVAVDEGLMIGWFANAIETARLAPPLNEEVEL